MCCGITAWYGPWYVRFSCAADAVFFLGAACGSVVLWEQQRFLLSTASAVAVFVCWAVWVAVLGAFGGETEVCL